MIQTCRCGHTAFDHLQAITDNQLKYGKCSAHCQCQSFRLPMIRLATPHPYQTGAWSDSLDRYLKQMPLFPTSTTTPWYSGTYTNPTIKGF